MTNKERIGLLKTTCDSFAKILGSDTEIALHDLRERRIVHIVNNYVTGRTIDYKMPATVYDSIISMMKESDCLVGYATHSNKGVNLRASHILYRDEKGVPVALICINQDVTKFEQMRNYIDSLICSKPINENDSDHPDPDDEDYIPKITQRIIYATIEQSKPSAIDTKEKKIEIIQQLEAKGVFSVKDAVPIVCKTLSISQATLYNYLRELRSNYLV